MRRRPWPFLAGGVVACALVVLLVVVLTGPPEIDSVDLSEAEAQACRDLVADLPATLAGQERVEVAGDTEYGAAWGDPAIVLTCGAEAVDTSSAPPCTVVAGVGWVVPEEGGETVLAADGYRPRVELVVPDDYAPAAELLIDLNPLVKEHAELEDRCL